MKQRIPWAGCILVASLGLGAGAAVVPYVKALSPTGGGTTFGVLTVPAGKVVVFDHMQFTSRTVRIHMNYNNGTSGSGIDAILGSVILTFTNPSPGTVIATPAPIRLFAGWSISNLSTTAATFIGLAMDDDDLYAGVGNEIDSLNMAGGTLLGGIQLDSPRPVVATVEQSEDMKTWTKDPGASVQKGDSAAQMEFTTTPDDAGAAFRVKARARP
ncbi:MAG: hypothetical protein KA248_06335 [Kiritimatiellae bacterium]|nr:hypothetical protein [Kiritimatiellia bacterium]